MDNRAPRAVWYGGSLVPPYQGKEQRRAGREHPDDTQQVQLGPCKPSLLDIIGKYSSTILQAKVPSSHADERLNGHRKSNGTPLGLYILQDCSYCTVIVTVGHSCSCTVSYIDLTAYGMRRRIAHQSSSQWYPERA